MLCQGINMCTSNWYAWSLVLYRREGLLLKDTFTLPYDIELIVMTVYNGCFA